MADQQSPTWPQGSSLTASDITETSVKLNWSFAEDNEGVTNYRIYQDGSLLDTVTSAVYSYDVSGLTAETVYLFKVEAGDAAGNWSMDGPSASVTTEGEPAPGDQSAPTWPNGSLTVSNVGATGATVTWSAAEDNVGVTSYRIYRDSELLDTVTGSVYSYDLSAGTTYNIKVEAGDAAGNWSTDGPTAMVTPVAAATVALTASGNAFATGEAVTLTVTMSGQNGTPAGTVTFMDGTATLGTVQLNNGVATFRTTSLQSGTFNLTAAYSGDAVYLGNTSNNVTLTFEALQPGPVMNYTLVKNYATASNGKPYISGFTMTLTAPNGVTDIQETKYRFNGQSDWMVYTGPFTFNASTTKVEYQSTDLQGNNGPVTVLDFRMGVVFTLLGTQ